jgi:hypothetical protein
MRWVVDSVPVTEVMKMGSYVTHSRIKKNVSILVDFYVVGILEKYQKI